VIDVQAIASALCREKYRLIERCLLGAIEQIEGRVPTNDEVMAHGRRLIHPDGKQTYTWKGKPIVEVPREPLKFVGHKAMLEIKSVFRVE
jgi:hypothetical protein